MHSAPSSPVLSVKTEFVGLASSAVCRALFLSSAGTHTPPAKAVALAGSPIPRDAPPREAWVPLCPST